MRLCDWAASMFQAMVSCTTGMVMFIGDTSSLRLLGMRHMLGYPLYRMLRDCPTSSACQQLACNWKEVPGVALGAVGGTGTRRGRGNVRCAEFSRPC